MFIILETKWFIQTTLFNIILGHYKTAIWQSVSLREIEYFQQDILKLFHLLDRIRKILDLFLYLYSNFTDIYFLKWPSYYND